VRFLVLVARHSGVCVMRQHSSFAGQTNIGASVHAASRVALSGFASESCHAGHEDGGVDDASRRLRPPLRRQPLAPASCVRDDTI
jgi:hypothetical protein